jgi:hypothetical protein
MRTAVLLVAALAAGCGTPATPSGQSTTTTTTTTAGSAPPTSASRTPSPEAAADGVDYSACADGVCEVFVTGVVDIPLGEQFGFTSFQVTRSPGRTAVFGGDPVNGNLRGYVDGTGHLSANEITMEVVSADDAGAVLRFSPRTDG